MSLLVMNPMKKVLMSVAAIGAFALGGAALANATSSPPTPTPAAKSDNAPDQVLRGSAAATAGAAAVKALGGGKVISVEKDDDRSEKVAYEVKVLKGKATTEVKLADDLSVVSKEADDGAEEHGDHGAGQDKGDGDGETDDDAPAATPKAGASPQR